VVVLLTGYSPEEMIGKSVQSYLSEWSIPNAIRGLARVAKGEIAKAEELEFVRKDGSIIHVEVNASPVFKGNRIVGVQIIVRDVLEKFKLGEVIDLARQYAENIVSTVRDPLVVLDSDLRIISANPSFYENFKVKSTETEGKSLYEIGDRQWDNPELRRLLTEILPAKSVITDFELTHTFPTIGRRVMLLNARKVQAEVGREPFILLAIEDITERKRQEKTLRDSEEKYRVIVERSWDAVVTFDAKGRISYASPSLLLITGHSPAEVEGKTLDNFLHKADVPKYIQYIKGVLQGEVFESHEMKIVKSDGAIGYAEINSSPIFDESGLVTGVQAILRDVSERHKLAEIKDRFISAVTHELRTPLVSIQGYLDLILSESGIVGQTKMDLETVKRNTNILSQLVDDLLDVQRLASGRMPLDLQPLNLQTLIQDCIQQVQPLITEKNHNLQLETPESEVTVVGDKTILTDESW
jgi:PAS domain S-box-containing protein